MTTTALKDHLSRLIHKEMDLDLLELVRTLLEKKDPISAERRMIMEGILRSEEDIAAGRTFNADEAERMAKDALKH